MASRRCDRRIAAALLRVGPPVTASVARAQRRRGPVLLVALVAVAVVVVGVGLATFLPRPPEPVGIVPPRIPLLVTVDHAGDPTAHVGFPTPITVHALGSVPVTGVELWLGAHRLATATNEDGGPAQTIRWSWTPATAGPAVLVARATDALGREVQSAPLRMSVDADPPLVQPVRQVEVGDGETALEAAARIGGQTADLARWNAGLDPAAPLEAGTIVLVPLAVAEVPRPPGGGELDVLGAIGADPLLDGAARAGTVTLASWSGGGPQITLGPPAAGTGMFVLPTVTPTVEDCTIELAVTGTAGEADGLAVYGLGPAASGFARLATMEAGGTSTWAAPAAPGDYLFSVSAFDANVEEHGDLVEVQVPSDCAERGWSGDVRLVGGELLGAATVDRAYLYLSLDGGPWRRVPGEPGTFVDRQGGRLDFGPYLPADLATHAVDLEAWGWQGGSLLDLGGGHHEPAPPIGSNPPPVGGGGGAATFVGGTLTELDWVTHGFVPGTKEFTKEEQLLRQGTLAVWTLDGKVKPKLEETFRWLTNATGVDAVVWQVAAFPMPPDLAPDVPGVLLQQALPVAEGTQGGDFAIDFRPIFAPSAQSVSYGDPLDGGVVGQLNLAQLGALASAPPSPVATTTAAVAATPAGPVSAGGVGLASEVFSPSWLLANFTPSVLYVRAIPMDGTTVAAGVSNFVRFDVAGDDYGTFDPSAKSPPPPPPKPTPATMKPYQLYLNFMPPANANPAFAECVMVTGYAEGVKQGAWGLEPGDFFCRVHPTTSGWSLAGAFEDFVDLVADAWDAVAGAWSWLQSQLASALAKYSGCSAIAGGSFCKGLAQVAISTALVAAGIPPSLPNTEELVALGKGELKEALVDLASQAALSLTGVDPCTAAELAKAGLGTSSCDDIAEQLIDDLVGQLAALKTQEATAITGAVVPYGVNVVVHPWGTIRPPRFRVTIARNVAVPLPASGECRMTLSIGATVTGWTHKAWDPATGWGTVTETVSGAPFTALTVPIPNPETAAGPVFELPSTLKPDATIYEVMLAALNKKLLTSRDYYLTNTAFWREPNNPTQVYVPGTGYVSQVDQANRAWVLLQNGTPVKAFVAPAPASPPCFDPVGVTSAIPATDLGFPCSPIHAFYWQLGEVRFTGSAFAVAACEYMYAQATGY